MRFVYTLQIINDNGTFTIPIRLQKSTDEKQSFKMGCDWNDEIHPVQFIKVVAKEKGVRITSRSEIAHICSQDELVSLYHDDESDKDVIIDKKSIAKAVPDDGIMKVVKVVPRSAIPLQCIGDHHYFVDLCAPRKKKNTALEKQLYSLFYQGMVRNQQVALVKYNGNGTINHGIIYPDKEGLRIFKIVPSTYLRKRKEEQPIEEFDYNEKVYDALVGGLIGTKVKHADYPDVYAERLQQVIKAAIEGQEYEPEKEEEAKPIVTDLSILLRTKSEPPKTTKKEKGRKKSD